MERNFYFIGIAFFGMINGLFNQVALLFALIHVQVLAPALLFGSTSLTLDVFLADGLDRDDHPWRHPGCHLRALCRRQGRFDRGFALDLAGGDRSSDAPGDGRIFSASGCEREPCPHSSFRHQ